MEFHVSLVGRRDLADEIYRQLRGAIVDGPLQPGDPLPPTRELARSLSVSRTTVTVAYDRLYGEGFVTSRVGAGTFVCGAGAVLARSTTTRAAGALQPRARVGSRPGLRRVSPTGGLDFRTGLPDATRFPFETWRRLMARQLRLRWSAGATTATRPVIAALREAIARHIGISRGVTVAADDVIVTNGTQQALDLIARVLLAPGDRVAVEAPGYRAASTALRVPRTRSQRRARRRPGRLWSTPFHRRPVSYTCRPHTSIRSVPRCRSRAARPAGMGRTARRRHHRGRLRQRVPLMSAGPSNRSRPSTPAVASSTWVRSPRRCCRRCGWASS